MEDRIKFSIIIPAFKSKFLKECIDSVLGQSYENFEIIIVNDASPENIDSIVSSYEDDRIVYRKNEKGFGGYDVIKNWNKGLSLCTGDYVICMGDDDKLLDNCLDSYCNLIGRHPLCTVFHIRTQIINEESEIVDIQEEISEVESVYAYIWNSLKDNRRQFIGDYLFSTKQLKKDGGFFYLPYAWGSDRISVTISAFNNGIAYSNEFGFQYRSNSGSITSSNKNTKGKIEAAKKLYLWYMDYLTSNKASNQMDELYRKMALGELDKYKAKDISASIATDIAYNIMYSFYWIINGKKNEIDFSTIKRGIYKGMGLLGSRDKLKGR